MLHDAGRDGASRESGVGNPGDGFDRGHLRSLHEGDRRAVTQAQEAVHGVRHAVHPVERDQLHAHDLGKELDLRLDVPGCDREMMDAVRKTHDCSSFKATPDRCLPAPTSPSTASAS